MEPKVSITFIVPGAQMYSEQKCKDNKAFEQTIVNTEYYTGRGKEKKKNKEKLVIYSRGNKPAKHHLNICKETYDHMIMPEGIPTIENWTKKHSRYVWSQYSKQQRLETHIKLIAKELNALSFTYEILDDQRRSIKRGIRFRG